MFSWSEKPEESDNDEVEDVLVGESPFVVIHVAGVEDVPYDLHVGRVGAVRRAILFGKSAEKITE